MDTNIDPWVTTPPGWENGNGNGWGRPVVPEPSSYGLIMMFVLFAFFLTRRKR